MLGITQKIQIVTLSVLRVLGEIARAIEEKLEPPGGHIVVAVTYVVEPGPELHQSSLGLEQCGIDARVGLAHHSWFGWGLESYERRMRPHMGIKPRQRVTGRFNRRNRNVVSNPLKSLALNVAPAGSLVQLRV